MPMGSICWPLNTINRSTKVTYLNQSVHGPEPQIHEVWILGFDRIICKVFPTARVEVPFGTVKEFVTDHLAENGFIIQIVGQLSINDSVQILGVPAQAWGNVLLFLCNLQSSAEATG